MSENRFWAAFGVKNPEETTPEGSGAQGQEPAEPAPQTTEEGAQGQEPAEPAEPTVEQQEEGNSQNGTGQTMTEEERHKQAALRRQREREGLEASIRSQLQKEHEDQIKGILGEMDLKDPETGERITTAEGYRQYQQKMKNAKLNRELKNGQLTQEGLETAILQNPKIAELVKSAEEKQKEAFFAMREQQLAEIRKLNANIQTLTDITQMETGPKFMEYVGMGMDYISAYRLANFDDITARARAAGEQAARNGTASKGHMQSSAAGGRNPSGVEITEAMRARYRRFNPSVTDKQIADMEKKLRK